MQAGQTTSRQILKDQQMMNLLPKCGRVDETKALYAEVLGFEVGESADGTCTVQKEGGTIIFSDAELWEGSPRCAGTIYFFVNDVDRYYDEIKEKAIVRWPLKDTSYGTREFAVKDCNEYTLALAQKRR